MPTNQLHPVYHSHSVHLGSRIDIDRVLPANLAGEDLDEWIEKLSEPPKYLERIAPVTTVVGTEMVRGKNWTDMMMRGYRVFLRIFTSISYYIRQALAEKFSERGMLPFMSADLDPDTLHRMIELDYEHGENSYGTFMEFFKSGVFSPCATVPFSVILPLLDDDFDRRIVIRMGLLFYWDMIKQYHAHLKSVHGETRFILPFWLPECGYNKATVRILHEEFLALAKAERIHDPHLLLLLDNNQAVARDNDIMMKSWNQIKHDKDVISVVFRDRSFSDWVTYSNPSVKKLIDRTIAKVDSALNDQGVDYCWSHFEEIESLTFLNKSAVNFEQKVVKLAQLSYMAVSPDVFVRRKMNGKFGKAKHEPQEVELREGTGWTDWHTHQSLGRWEGVLDSNAQFKLVDENRPYTRRSRTGKVVEIGPQCWKLAFVRARAACVKAAKGDPETLKGGFLEILAGVCGAKDPKILKRNVADFLVAFTHIQWREHFLQHEMSEADVELREIVDKYLLKDVKRKLKDAEYVTAGVAVQGYYFILESQRSHGTAWENMDQRAVYQATAMLVLGMSNLITILHWQNKSAEARKLLDLIKTELIDFQDGYHRYRLADYGVTEQEWVDALRSQVEDSPMNVVERATRRIAARHLRPLGHKKEFTKEDENITTNCGHVWAGEIENTNYKWENKLFCGLREE